MVTTKVTTVWDAATVLAGLSSARTPWLTLALAGPADHSRLAATAADPDVTVIDITDPQAVPVTISPFEPAPGYPVQAYADRLAGLSRRRSASASRSPGPCGRDCGEPTRTAAGTCAPARPVPARSSRP